MGRCHLHIKNDGYVHIDLTTYYGKDEKDYTTQLEKLTYIVTWMYVYYGCDFEEFYDSYMWQDFIKAFCDYVNDPINRLPRNMDDPKCLGIKIDGTITGNYESPYDYLDHQSNPNGKYDDTKCIVKLYDTDAVMNFIFNKNLWLHTDCD